MAIKIPSKNIYEINNPKIRDNVIDNVSVEENIVKPKNDYEVNVYNQEPFNIVTNDTIIDPNNKDRQTKLITKSVPIQGGNFLWAFFCSHTEYNSYKKSQTITIKIPKVKNNSYISKIYYGLNEDGENNIKYSLFGSKQSGTVTANLSFDITSSGGTNPKITNIAYSNPTIDFEDEHYEIPKKETFVYEGFVGGEIGGTNGTATSEATLYDSSSLSTSVPYNYIENGIEYYCIDIDFIVGVRIVKMGGAVLEHYETNMSGTYEEYILKQIEITIYGNTIGIDLTDGSVTYGSGNKPYSLSGNELLQDSGKVFVPFGFFVFVNGIDNLGDEQFIYLSAVILDNTLEVGDKIFYEKEIAEIIEVHEIHTESCVIKAVKGGKFEQNMLNAIYVNAEKGENILLSKHLADNILNEYKKGKETATLLCDISDYYNENGEKVIDIKTEKMSFRLHDEVIPYVFGADKQDKPMSKYQDGSAKVFEVVGSNIIYDGAVWQELSLLEKKQENT